MSADNYGTVQEVLLRDVMDREGNPVHYFVLSSYSASEEYPTDANGNHNYPHRWYFNTLRSVEQELCDWYFEYGLTYNLMSRCPHCNVILNDACPTYY